MCGCDGPGTRCLVVGSTDAVGNVCARHYWAVIVTGMSSHGSSAQSVLQGAQSVLQGVGITW